MAKKKAKLVSENPAIAINEDSYKELLGDTPVENTDPKAEAIQVKEKKLIGYHPITGKEVWA